MEEEDGHDVGWACSLVDAGELVSSFLILLLLLLSSSSFLLLLLLLLLLCPSYRVSITYIVASHPLY